MNATDPAIIERLEAQVYRIPTDAPESDGTLEWDHSDLVAVHASTGGQTGLGWTYASPAAAMLIADSLQPAAVNQSALSIERIWQGMGGRLRNIGHSGVGVMAISAVDTALWDLKARLLGLPLVHLFGSIRDEVPIYGSGGFTSYTEGRLNEQLCGWVADGIHRVKMKVGRDAAADFGRVASPRKAVGDYIELFVDANGGYSRKQALKMAQVFSEEQGIISASHNRYGFRAGFHHGFPLRVIDFIAMQQARTPAPSRIPAWIIERSHARRLAMAMDASVGALSLAPPP